MGSDHSTRDPTRVHGKIIQKSKERKEEDGIGRFKIVELVGTFLLKIASSEGNEIEKVPGILHRSDGICRRVHPAEGIPWTLVVGEKTGCDLVDGQPLAAFVI